MYACCKFSKVSKQTTYNLLYWPVYGVINDCKRMADDNNSLLLVLKELKVDSSVTHKTDNPIIQRQ